MLLSWDVSVPAGASQTISYLTTFSPIGLAPLSTTKTADEGTVDAGGADGYTITLHNSNQVAVSVDSITDTLPDGFAYVPGSTTGAKTDDPVTAGQTLTWAGPVDVEAGGELSLHFAVTAATIAGTYYNNAGADAESVAVAPTGDTAPVTVTETVSNHPPVASDQSVSTDEGTPVDVTLLATDPDGDALTYSVVGGPAHGSLGALVGDEVTYTPAAGYSGPDSFTFEASDGSLDSNTATVSITVNAVDHPPVASDQSVSTDEGDAGRRDARGDGSGWGCVDLLGGGGPAHGSLGALVGDEVTYTPAAGYSGPDSFTFEASDGSLDSNTATVSITVASSEVTTALTAAPASGDFADPTEVSAVLTDAGTSAPVPGEPVSFTLNGHETCTGTTDNTGTATCIITPGRRAGPTHSWRSSTATRVRRPRSSAARGRRRSP